jgi:hypothetical protein
VTRCGACCGKGSCAAGFLAGIAKLAGTLGIATEDLDAWLADLNARVAAGNFYFAIPWAYVLARK